MIAVAVLFTRFAVIGFTAKWSGSTQDDVIDSSFVTGQHTVAVLRPIPRTIGPEYVGQLGHLSKQLILQVIHEAVDDALGLVLCNVGQMGINGRCLWRHVSKVFLNQPEIDTEFHQMRGVGMPERSYRCPFVDTAFSESLAEGGLDVI